MEKLKPCPLCLCNEFELCENTNAQATAIYCTNCAYGVEDSTKTLDELAILHNMRPAESDESEFRDVILTLFSRFGQGIIKSVDKYRSDASANKDYDKARVILDLQFPRDLILYRVIKQLKETYDTVFN